MRRFIFLCLVASGLSATRARAASWSLASPAGSCAITVTSEPDGSLSYTAARQGHAVIYKSPLGLVRNDQSFTNGLALETEGPVTASREQYKLLAGPNPDVDQLVHHRNLIFTNQNGASLILELAASDEGVAFRYEFPTGSANVYLIESELTGFAISPAARGWLQPYHAAGKYTPAYEDFYFHVSPGDPPPKSRAEPRGWAFPALFQTPDAGWALLTESGTDESYCACHLGPDSSSGLYHIAFPFADEQTQGHPNRFPPQPRYTLPWTMPWRVIVLGQNAGDIALSTFVTDLAPPSKIADTSWIQTGRASWAWWSYPEGPVSRQLFDHFTDFAHDMGWQYTLFDAGWWNVGLSNIASYAHQRGVYPLAWMFASDFYDPVQRARKLDEARSAGVEGVKVDFWCSDRQEAIAAMQDLFADAAKRHMVVDLHGCTIPRGWQRTWPNYLTAEAVLGDESYFYEPRYTEKAAELNCVLPFTRNAVGPMDLTPVAISPKKYKRLTTAAHELAAALIFTSGIIHCADKPEMFESLPPEVLQIFRDAPAHWDETRCLIGEPGQEVVFARRRGGSWFIAGINGTPDPRPANLDLTPFSGFRHRLLVTEGAIPTMQVAAQTWPLSNGFSHIIPPRGGFILRLDNQ